MPGARTEPTVLPKKLMEDLVPQRIDWVSASWRDVLHSSFANGLAASSRKIYKAGENSYIGFCQRYSIVPLPVSESELCKFVTFLPEQRLKYHMIKTYLAPIKYLYIRSGLQEPFHGVHMPRLEYTRGLNTREALSSFKCRA